MKETLAYALRPKTLNDILGQAHLKPIFSKMIENKHPLSMILYGPPGCGKTTLASALANDLGIPFRLFNASTGNKKEMDIIIEEAKLYQGMFVIIDEIHRLNKDKQDYLLPHIESGLLVIVGCTTANPYHAINPAIRSRCQIFEVKPLQKEDIAFGISKACQKEGYEISSDCVSRIAHDASGDIRYAYNLLELCFLMASNHTITLDTYALTNAKTNLSYDKDEDEYYDTLSGFQKSIRGSDPNGALYYLAKLIEFDDFPSLERRLLTLAYEDVGLANPMACARTVSALDACRKVGFPEARIILSVAVIDLALSPKSRSAEAAIDKAIQTLKEHPLPAPNYLRLTPVGLKDEERYDYSRSDLWEYIQYLPFGLDQAIFYEPDLNSTYEKNLNIHYQNILKHGRSKDIVKLNKKKRP